jgi:hypothetical protein
MHNIDSIVEKWLHSNIKTNNNFFKKLVIYWPKIVGYSLSRHSIPHKIITENNKLTLYIYVYNGPISIGIQSIISVIKNNIILNIGYCNIDEIKVMQKLPTSNHSVL